MFTVWNLDTGEKEYIISEHHGFSNFDINYKQEIIALAEFGMNPNVYIYDTNLRKLGQIQGKLSPE